MALSASLQTALGDDVTDLGGLLGTLGGSFTELDLPGVSIDTGGLDGIGQSLSGLDLGSVSASVEGLAQLATERLGGLPVVGDLLQPVTGVLETLEALSGGDDVDGLLETLRRLGRAGPEHGAGLAGVQSHVAALLELRSDPLLGQALGLAGQLLPGGIDLDGAIERLGRHGGGVSTLLRLVGSLMSIETVSRELGGYTGLIERQIDPERLGVELQRLRGWALEGNLGTLLDGIDPDDANAAERLARPVGEFVAAIRAGADSVVHGLAFGEATLVHSDVAGAVGRLEAAGRDLRAASSEPVHAMSLELRELAEPLLSIDLGQPAASLDAVWDEVGGLLDGLISTVEDIDAARVAAPVTAGLDAALEPLRTIQRAIEELIAALRGAFDSVRLAIEELNLSAVAEALTSALRPAVEAIAALQALISEAQEQIEAAAAAVTAAMTAVRDGIDDVAGQITAAFAALKQMVDDLNIEGLVDQLRDGLQQVAATLESIQLQPFFDTAIDVMDTTRDILDKVPLDLLPDDTRQELSDLVAPVKAIDFQGDVADPLATNMRGILEDLDTTVLDALQEAYAAAVQFLESVNPRPALEAFETEHFDPFIAQVQAIDPAELLRPVSEQLEQAKQAIAALDVSGLLDPVEQVFDELLARFDELDPAAAIAPLEERVDALRDLLSEKLYREQWYDRLDELEGLAGRLLARVDLSGVIAPFDAAFDGLLAQVGSRIGDGGAAGGIVAAVLQGSGQQMTSAAFAPVAGWIGGGDGAGALRGRLGGAADALERTLETVRGLDPAALAAEVQPAHRSLLTAVQAMPEGAVVRRRLEPMLAGASPTELLGSVATSHQRYLDGLEAAVASLRALEQSGWSQVTSISQELREALLPLSAVSGQAVALFRRFGVDPQGKRLSQMLLEVLETLRPSRSLSAVEPLVAALRDKAAEIVGDGLIEPVRSRLQEIEALIDTLDIGIVGEELGAVHAQIRGEIEAFRPSVVLAEVLGTVETVQAEIDAFDPLAPVEAVIDEMKQAIAEVLDEYRPTVLLADVLDIYDSVLAATGALDIAEVLDPVLTALHDLEAQLEEGLDAGATALGELQEALP